MHFNLFLRFLSFRGSIHLLGSDSIASVTAKRCMISDAFAIAFVDSSMNDSHKPTLALPSSFSLFQNPVYFRKNVAYILDKR